MIATTTSEAGRARFVEEAGRVHLIRNEGSTDLEPVAFQLTPFQADRRTRTLTALGCSSS